MAAVGNIEYSVVLLTRFCISKEIPHHSYPPSTSQLLHMFLVKIGGENILRGEIYIVGKTSYMSGKSVGNIEILLFVLVNRLFISRDCIPPL